MVLRCRSLDQSWHGPSAYSTRISSAPKPATGSGRRSLEILPKRAAPAPSPRKGQWLQSPSRTLCRRLPEFDLNSAEFLSSPSCTRASTSPMTPPSRPTNATAETRFSLVALHAKDTHVKSHSRPQDRPDILAQPARCTQRDDQVGEAHALACGYPTALRWGYHGVRLPRAAHKAHPSPGRRRRTQVRLASPAERWGGFGTCVQSKAPGPHSSPTSRAQLITDSDAGVARRSTTTNTLNYLNAHQSPPLPCAPTSGPSSESDASPPTRIRKP